ncbi:MAG: CpaE family protein [Candidatus Brocadiia bacterium]
MPNIRICVCHPNEQHCENIIDAFKEQDPELSLLPVTDLRRATERVKEEEAAIVVVGVDAPGDPTLRTITSIESMDELDPGIVVVSQQPSQELLVACMRAGCDEFLEFPIDSKELADALDRLYRKKGIVDRTRGQTTAIYSATGGTGNTTIASNLGVVIAEISTAERPACLLDLNTQFGNVALMLDIREFSHSVADACVDIDRMDPALMENYMSRHQSGLDVLPCPLEVDDMEEVDPASLMGVLQICDDLYEHVLLDLPHKLNAITVAGLDAADQVFLLCDMMLPSIHNTKQAIDTLTELDYKPSQLKLIINRYYDSDEISLQEISEHLQLPLYWVLPYDSPLAIAAVNSGRSFREVDEKSEATLGLVALAHEMAGVEMKQKRKKRFSLFGR